MRVPYEEATPFTRWFNFNPVAMQVRWLYLVWASGGGTTRSRKLWLNYLRTLGLITPREFFLWLWMVLVERRYFRWVVRPLGTLRRFFR